MARWRYLFHDLESDAFLAELPLVDVGLERRLACAGTGSFAALLRLGDNRVRATNWRVATEKGRVCCYTERDGTLLSCHAIWETTDHYSNQTRELRGEELWSYFHRRYISYDRTYAAVDQFDIARDLLIQEALEPGGNIGLQVDAVGTTPLSGRVRDRTYLAGDGKDLAEAIEQLSAVIDGFEFQVDVSYTGAGATQRRFILGYPRIGRDDSGLHFRLPGDIEDFDWPQTAPITRSIALGENGLRQDAIDMSAIGAGIPLLEVTYSYGTVSVAATLAGHALADLARLREPVVPTITLRADAMPVLGSYAIGDDVWVHLEEPSFFPGPWASPDGIDRRLATKYRLIGDNIRPDQEKVELVLNSTSAMASRVLVTG